MAQTTTHIQSDACIVSLDNANGTLTDISGSNTSAEIVTNTPLEQTFTFTGADAISSAGKRTTNITLVIVYSTTTNESMDILKRWKYGSSHTASRSIQIDIPDSSTGSDRYYGEVKLGDLTIPSAADEFTPRPVTATFTGDGAFAWTAI